MFFKRKEPIVDESHKSYFDDYKEVKIPERQDTMQHIEANILAHMYNRVINGYTAWYGYSTVYQSDFGIIEVDFKLRNISEVKSKTELRKEIKDKLDKLDTWDKDLISDIKKLVSKL